MRYVINNPKPFEAFFSDGLLSILSGSCVYMDEPVIPFDRFSRWIYAVCVVNFDVDLGQTLESVYPSYVMLSEAERNSVSYLSFPDSHSSCVEHTQHHFRFKSTSVDRLILKHFPVLYRNYTQSLLPVVGACFGYALFRQQKDLSLKRQYSQKSVVVLSPLPFDALFYEVTKSISQIYFSNGICGIEKACKEIDTWPAPKSDEQLSLPLLGVTYTFRIPGAAGTVMPASQFPVGGNPFLHEDEQDCCSPSSLESPPSTSAFSKDLLRSDSTNIPNSSTAAVTANVSSSSRDSDSSYDIVPEKDVILRMQEEIEVSLDSRRYAQAFAPVLSHLQRLWELVITAQPLLVMGPNPGQTSQTVQALVSCIAPLAFCADYRPFFTIYDPEFKNVSRGSISSPIAILGVTNPFFSKALNHWPNVIRLGKVRHIEKKRHAHQLSSKILLEDLKPGLYSQYKPFLKRDAGFFKRLKKALTDGTPEVCISRAIQRFFQELTLSFLIPLEQYISTLMPLHRDISPFRCVPELNRFNMDDFFRTLERAGPRLTCDVKGDWVGLYKSFFSGPHFVHWLSQREADIRQKLHSLHLDAIIRTNFSTWLEERSEVEIVDMILQLNQEVVSVLNVDTE
uniref:UDENN domain-containing protein n=1 Tax=Mesocestoides corti TaxID=53468 RepID=A0A5K3EHD3_MESCO